MATLSDGVFPGGGELVDAVCRACDWRGAPLLFDSPSALAAYRRGLAGGDALPDEAAPEDEAPPFDVGALEETAPSPRRAFGVVLVALAGVVAVGPVLVLLMSDGGGPRSLPWLLGTLAAVALPAALAVALYRVGRRMIRPQEA